MTTGDSGPPEVGSTSPPNGTAGVTTNSVIIATFSEPMQSLTINTNTFTVTDGKGNIGGTVSYSGTTASFTPLSKLSDSTTYTARITNGVKDLAGNAMASDYSWSFTTVDITTPIVSSTSPPNGAASVTTNSIITATFSEAMQSSTINTNTFTVSDGKGNIGGTVSYSGTTATFTPLSKLSDSTTYTARITNGVKDLAGNAMASEYSWSFTTVDITTPIVSSTSPPNGAASVTTNSVIIATFSEAMQSSTINTNTFTVSDGKGNIGGTVSYSGTTATFTPLSNLSDSTTYTARITNGVKDLAGNTLASEYSWSFTTGDFTAPMVVSMNPFNGATGVAITSIITAIFSEAMQSSTINTNTFTVSDGKGNIGGTVSYSGTTATFTPLSKLSDSTIYTARITTSARDVAGNMLISDHTWSFTTIDTTSPRVISANPVNGAAEVAINSTITVLFSEAMLASSINTNTFVVSAGGKDVSGTVLYNGATAVFLPSSNLSHSTMYTARITTGMMDLAFNEIASDYTWNFVTTGDFVAPTIIATSPVNGDAGVAINRGITVTFSEVMQLSTITTDTFSVNDDKDNIRGTISCHGATATFTPLNNLLPYTAYKARIATGARDLAGNALASPYTWSFETSGDVDSMAPKVILTNPVNGAAGVEVSSVVTATFSEMIDATDVTTDTFLVNDGSDNISGIVSYNQTTATFIPSSNLSTYITHTAKITKGIKDLAGNPMISHYTWSFTTTGDFTAPTVIYTSPVNGAAGVNVSSDIAATFSEMMDASTLGTDTYSINNGSNNLGGVVSYRDKIITFTPNTNLDFNTIYTATITTGARDIAGNPIASAYTWSFTTELVPSTPTPGHTETPTPTPTVPPTTTPSSTPTPSECSTDKIEMLPEKMQIESGEIDIVTATITGANDCPVKGETIRAKITEGKRRIVVSPQFSITNYAGQAVFTIKALNNTGRATVKFKSGNVKTAVKVKIVE
ncbi:MAG: hypothetical protein E3K40_04675 [Candidatus Brocadia sp.]|nr:Ig-like domain-containing protein [Candidatus Brocadia sp.]MDG6026006.1 hypothetical protein [Candidatus Brocadia sp.]